MNSRFILILFMMLLFSCGKEEVNDKIYKYVGYEKIDSALLFTDNDFNVIQYEDIWPSDFMNTDKLFSLSDGILGLMTITIIADSLHLKFLDGTSLVTEFVEYPDFIDVPEQFNFFKPNDDILRFSSCALFKYRNTTFTNLTESICENQIALHHVDNFIYEGGLERNDTAGGYIISGIFEKQ